MLPLTRKRIVHTVLNALGALIALASAVVVTYCLFLL